ncbi:MAG: hypothetical protein WC565_09045 [Parcubacteria group bacterium]|jgi:hypothetical protein
MPRLISQKPSDGKLGDLVSEFAGRIVEEVETQNGSYAPTAVRVGQLLEAFAARLINLPLHMDN